MMRCAYLDGVNIPFSCARIGNRVKIPNSPAAVMTAMHSETPLIFREGECIGVCLSRKTCRIERVSLHRTMKIETGRHYLFFAD